MSRFSTFAPLCAAALFALSEPVAAADASRGAGLAMTWCSSCHLVSRDSERQPAAPAPTFLSIANDGKKTDAYLKRFIANPHYPMPNLDLGRREIDDLVAYIRSLGS